MFTAFIFRIAFKKTSGLLMLSLLLLPWPTRAQPSLDDYINQAFESNLGLQQKRLDLDKALYALKEAKTYYLPDVGLNATYTRANGGRTIDLPIGDLLNPIYSTLNQLTAGNNFPSIDNQTVLLNPDNFYDAKIHTAMPLINMEIGYNKRIKSEAISAERAAVNVYKRELVKDIKTAFYRYDQASKAVVIYENSLKLVSENVRVNESLLRNGARNATALVRSQAERERVEAAKHQQENDALNAKRYFNFLLNRDLDAEINPNAAPAEAINRFLAEEPAAGGAVREELLQLKAAEQMNIWNTRIQRSGNMPRLNAFLDLGSQAFNFNVNSKSLYYFGGLSLQWDLFAGGRNRFKARQAELATQAARTRYDEAELAFRLQEQQAYTRLNTASANYKSAKAQVALAERYYNDQFKIYKEGQLLYIELIDAQNQLTNARLQLSVALAEIGIAVAELERSQASYPL
jgi:outer membrane protein TolC